MTEISQNYPHSSFWNKKNSLVIFFLFFNAVLLANLTLFSVISVDEPFYINAGKVMLDSGDWLLPKYETGELRLNKPILIYWLVSIGQFITGDPLIGSRLIAVLFTNFHLIGIVLFCNQLFKDKSTGYNAAWIFAATPQVLERSHTILPEILVICLITWTLLIFWRMRAAEAKSMKLQLAFYFLLALNFLIKGPPGVVLSMVVIISYISIKREWGLFKKLVSVPGIILFLVIGLSWHAYLLHSFGMEFMSSLFQREILHRLSETKSPLTFLSIFEQFHPWIWLVVLIISWSLYKKRPLSLSSEFCFIITWFTSLLLFINLFVRELHTHYTLDIVVPVIVLTGYLFKNDNSTHRLLLMIVWTVGIALSSHFHWLLPDTVFPTGGISLYLSVAAASTLLLWVLLFKWHGLNMITSVAMVIMVLTMIKYHFILEKGKLIHSPELYERMDGPTPAKVISGDAKIGTYVKFYWPTLESTATHSLVYSFDDFVKQLNRGKAQFAFCSEESWSLLPDETRAKWTIVNSTYSTRKERFAESAQLKYKNAIRVPGRHFIKYYLIKQNQE